MGKPRVLYWFRTDLRLHDSPALKAALDLNPSVLWPVFTWDPHYVKLFPASSNRWQFMIDCQNDLSASIAKLNGRSRLLVVRESPHTLLPKLFRAWRVTHLVFEKDTDAHARARDEAVCAEARKAGVEVLSRPGRTLWDSDAVVRANGGNPTMTLAQLRKAGDAVGPIARPIDAPLSLPALGDTPPFAGGAAAAGPAADFSVPTLDELSLPRATTPHRGGESLALERLRAILQDKAYVAAFRKPETSPAAVDKASTTLLSPFLHFGALSPRLFYHEVHAVCAARKDASKPPESLTGQLLFRDMYFAAQAVIGPEFGQAAGNKHCRFIPWHLPSKRDAKTGLAVAGEYTVDSAEAEEWFARWKAGTTGFPWIDAHMRQLREEGWMHHLGRHSVACFLTRGGCYVDWERGADVFAELLLDHEPACNAGNWQWLSCTAFFSQYFRCYGPVSFGKKWDGKGEFIRRWVPELANLDAKYIYEPWKAPAAAQKKAKVSVVAYSDLGGASAGNNYPEPVFDFEQRKQVCLAAMKQAYDVGLRGDDERVVNGKWAQLFPGGSEGRQAADDEGPSPKRKRGGNAKPGEGEPEAKKGKRR
ncbi:(6-4)DNA photolyase [Diplonema papillatum]|nr:(6-4)DNA photolyase [Diplonema papillatum]|eukprot:gene12231-18897_t